MGVPMFRRGFKTWSEETAAHVRQALQIAMDAPLEPLRMAEYLSVPVLRPLDLSGLAPEVIGRLSASHREAWSAITVANGRHKLIVINPAHSQARQNSSLAHELAHIILDHEPSLMFMAPGSGAVLRTHNKEQEDEAGWLAGTLLLPRAALLKIRRRRLTNEEACTEYFVSAAMLRFRLNATGVNVQIRRAGRI
ncbi:MAG: ImmA/IrrE family metallo-endopeptidase [Acidobacteria bacterium]|nr:MAG: ImmA/IrrE family metallo-endopeptidase [Acidobacteriota bacterium]